MLRGKNERKTIEVKTRVLSLKSANFGLSWALIFGLCVLVLPAVAGNKSKPNVLLICIDDLNTQLRCYGNTFVQSPNADRLAKMGVRFDRAYANYPVCNPSRTSMLSGLYPERTQVLSNNTAPRSKLPNAVFLPELFKKNGYYTAGIGKIFHGAFMDTINWDEWMNPKDAEDDEASLLETEHAEAAGGGDRREERQKMRRERRAQSAEPAVPRKKVDKGDSSKLPFGWHATDTKDEQEPDGQIATRAIEILEKYKDGPFFLAVGFHKPHVGHVAPKKYFELYPPDKIPLPKEPSIEAQGIPPIARGKYYPDLTEVERREIISHYAACITFMDGQLGRVMDAMDRLKLWDDTIVVYWGDHGWHWGEHGGMWAKGSLMEESARLPLFIVAPGKKKRAVCDRVVESVDIYPTIADFCGIEAPKGLQGRSLIPLLENSKRDWDGMAYTVVSRAGSLGRRLSDEKWTYIEWPKGEAQLYDAKKDPKEYRNLAKDPGHAKVVAEMKEKLARFSGK